MDPPGFKALGWAAARIQESPNPAKTPRLRLCSQTGDVSRKFGIRKVNDFRTVSINTVALEFAPQRVQADPQGTRRPHLVTVKPCIHGEDVLFFDIGEGLNG